MRRPVPTPSPARRAPDPHPSRPFSRHRSPMPPTALSLVLTLALVLAQLLTPASGAAAATASSAATTTGAATTSSAAATSSASNAVQPEPYRPALHFSPARNWLNDPNGLVFHKGLYHLFFQHNPEGNDWGNMSWGHATSPDLVTWTERPVAIPYDATEGVFSGSVVLDRTNSSGLGSATNPPLVAVYTSAYTAASGRGGIQAQSLAYSLDDGTTWTKYAGNPVLDHGLTDFRDPKVFAYGGEWRMVVALSTEHRIAVYRSSNLRQWQRLSTFGPVGATGGLWECPDLFPLDVDGDPAKRAWVMVVSLSPGSIAGGSGTQYFVGDFDGTTFTPRDSGSFTPPTGRVLGGFDGSTAWSSAPTGTGWAATGSAFGARPATGTLPQQQPVSGWTGQGYASSYTGGDAATGTLTSPAFTIDRRWLNLQVGGGRHPFTPGASTRGVDPQGQVLADFESSTWGGWAATGDLAGRGPSQGASQGGTTGQRPVTGYRGQRLANTFLDGDAATGTLTSPAFTLTQPKLALLVGGGNHPWGQPAPTAVVLKVDGAVVRSATGTNSETLAWQTWDVSDLVGRRAVIEVIDDNTGGWGHILLDDVVATSDVATTVADFEGHTPQLPTGWRATGELADHAVPAEPAPTEMPSRHGLRVLDTCVVPDRCDAATGRFVSAPFTVTEDHLAFLLAAGNHPWPAGETDPARTGTGATAVNLVADGRVVRTATGNGALDLDWRSFDVRDLRGRSVHLEVVDESRSGTWGHVVLDHVVQTNRAPDPISRATAVTLVVDGAVVRSATGRDSENLDWVAWDLKDLQGRTARIQVLDHNRQSWGHVLMDQAMLADTAATSALERVTWLDHGRDNYAGVTFNDAPGGARVFLGWMSNWDYATTVPTAPWRGQMTLPRRLSLVSTPQGPRLRQQPVLGTLPTAASATVTATGAGSTVALPAVGVIDVTLGGSGSGTAGVHLVTGPSEYTSVMVQRDPDTLVVDRTRSGQTGFSPAFASTERAPLGSAAQRLRIVVDRSSVEVFADDGRTVVTDLVLPTGTDRRLRLLSTDAATSVAATVTTISTQ